MRKNALLSDSITHRASMRRLWTIVAASVLSWTALHPAPAQANASVDCAGLKLTKASGIPRSSVHNYAFEGTCKLTDYFSDKKEIDGAGYAVASALWDYNSRTYTEHVHFVNGADTQVVIGKGGDTIVNKGPHVGTGAEDATFNCNLDPVIHKNAVCTLISHSNATGWGGQSSGFGYTASTGRPLLQGHASQARAAALSRHNASINCKGLRLTAASGVPGGKKHTYKFTGTCNLYHTLDGSGGLQVTRVLANGIWDAAAQQAKEGVTVLANPNEGGGGWNTTYTCTDDPWLNRHAKCSKTSQLGKTPRVYDPITDILNRRPITMGRVNAKRAAQLSKSHHQNASTDGAKKPGASLVNHKATAGSAHSNVKNLHITMPLHVNRKPATGVHSNMNMQSYPPSPCSPQPCH